MMKNNTATISSILPYSEIIIPVMHHYLSARPDEKIKISKSLFAYDPFIVPIKSPDINCITLEEFLAIADERMAKEMAYKEEINQLKKNICEEFNKLCKDIQNEEFIDFVRDQRQRILEAVRDETRIEDKMIVQKFLNDMLNRYESEALDLDNFEQTAQIIIWKPLLTPFPIGVLEELKKQIEEMEVMKNEEPNGKIENIASHIVSFIKSHMKPQELKDSDFESSEELRTSLEKLGQERKVCNITISDMLKSGRIAEEFQRICVKNVKIEMSLKAFLDSDIKMNYDELNLKGKIEGNVYKKLNFQRHIKSLSAEFGSGNYEEYQQMEKILSNLKLLSALNLNFSGNNIRKEGAKIVSAALRKLKNISTLNLNFSQNNIQDKGAKAVSAALTELKNISTLTLNLSDNNIGDEGAKAVSAALRELKNISTLYLNLEWNNTREEGANAVSAALRELKNISTLDLNLRNNKIGKERKAALQELKLINENFSIYCQAWSYLSSIHLAIQIK